MAAVTPHQAAVVDGLVDPETFFERAARGERDGQAATAAPDHALGAAALPRSRPPATIRPQSRPDGQSDATSAARRRAARRVAIVVLPTITVVGSAVLVATSLGGSDRAAPAAVERPSAVPASPTDVLAPRVSGVTARGDGHLTGVVYDPGSGVRSVELVVDGQRRDIRPGACRPICPPALRFSLASDSSEAMRAVAVVVADAAGNKTIAKQTLTAPARDHLAAKLTARLERPAQRAGYAIAGRLTDTDGAPIRGGQVELVGAARTDDAVPRVAGATTTDAAGRWRIASLHGSHVYRARHLADSDTKAVSAPVRATVRADLTLHVGRHGRTTVVVGRVRPATDVRLLLASRRDGGWRNERVARANASGRFRLPVPARLHGPVAVFVAPDPDLPYAPAGRVVDLARP